MIYEESLKAPLPTSVTLNTSVVTETCSYRDFVKIKPLEMFFIFLVKLPSPCPLPFFSFLDRNRQIQPCYAVTAVAKANNL